MNRRTLLIISALLLPSTVLAKTFDRPSHDAQFIGQNFTVIVKEGDSYSQLARKYDIGYDALGAANPNINPKNLPIGTVLVIPDKHLLPPKPWRGIVANLPQMRMFYFPKTGKKIYSYPIGIRRKGWNTPLGRMKITQKKKNPPWIVPKAVQKALAKQGIKLPNVVPTGPENPLGKYAMRLSYPTYLIHGTNEPIGVGTRVTAGCLRMYPEDIAELFGMAKVGTHVNLLSQSFQIDVIKNTIYLTVFKQINDSKDAPSWETLIPKALDTQLKHHNYEIDWSNIDLAVTLTSGQPLPIGLKSNQ